MDVGNYVEQLIETEREGMTERAEWISQHRPQYSHGMSMFGVTPTYTIYTIEIQNRA